MSKSKLITPAGLRLGGSREVWSILRIMSEFVEGFTRLDELDRPAIALFGSARLKEGHPYYDQVRDLSRRLSEAGFALITGGGPGLMEAGNRGAADVGAPSVGLNIKLPNEQMPNPYATVKMEFDFFPVRKAMYSYAALAAIAAPGGYGTLDELFTLATLRQTGEVAKIPVYLFGSTFWEGLLCWMRETLVPLGTITAEDVDSFIVVDDAEALVCDLTKACRKISEKDLGRL